MYQFLLQRIQSTHQSVCQPEKKYILWLFSSGSGFQQDNTVVWIWDKDSHVYNSSNNLWKRWLYKSGALIWIHLKMEAKKTDGVRFFGVNITHSPAAVVL